MVPLSAILLNPHTRTLLVTDNAYKLDNITKPKEGKNLGKKFARIPYISCNFRSSGNSQVVREYELMKLRGKEIYPPYLLTYERMSARIRALVCVLTVTVRWHRQCRIHNVWYNSGTLGPSPFTKRSSHKINISYISQCVGIAAHISDFMISKCWRKEHSVK